MTIPSSQHAELFDEEQRPSTLSYERVGTFQQVLFKGLRRGLPPVILFFISRLLTGNPFAVGDFAKWDSGLYLDIVEKGYNFSSCQGVPGCNPNDWCGNAGWFPGYPFLITALHSITYLSPVTLGVLVSAFFLLGVLTLIWNVGLEARFTMKNVFLLSLAAFFPGAIYYHAVFPLSMVLFFLLATGMLLQKRKGLASGVSSALAAFSYSTGFIGGGTGALLFAQSIWKKSLKGRLLTVPVGAVIGFCFVLAIHWYTTGKWNAFFLIQAKYGHGMHNPFATWWTQFSHSWFSDHRAPAFQQAFILLLLLLSLGSFFFSQKKSSELEKYCGIHTAIFWLFPLVMGAGVALYRAEALLCPIVLCLKRMPGGILCVLVVVAAYLHFLMGQLFFQSVLM